MKKNTILFIKGLIIGLGKIIPGVSGSMLAISLGVYEEAIRNIRYLFKNKIYFISLGLGILISIMFGSKIILYFLKNYYVYTMFLFIGLLLGVIPSINKKMDKKYYIYSLIISILIVIFLNINSFTTFVYSNNFINNIQVLLVGFIEAFTMIFPGISGTAVFLILGYYNFIMMIFSQPFLTLFTNPQIILLFFGSLIISFYVLSLVMNYLFDKHQRLIYSIILGFSISSIYFLFKDTLIKIKTITTLIISIIFMIIGVIISNKFHKL